MKTLLIYLPIYNGGSIIKRTLDALFDAVDALSDELKNNVIIHINDNASTDNTFEICQSYSGRHNFHIASNHINLGGTYNLGKGLKIDYCQDYTWMISDDDLVMPDALVRLFSFFNQLNEKKIEVDLVFLTALVVFDQIDKKENILELVINNTVSGWKTNHKFNQPVICKFPDLVDPQIEASTVGPITVFIFNSRKVRTALNNIEFASENDLKNISLMTHKIAHPHVFGLVTAFSAETVCLVDPAISIVSPYGQQAWIADRARIVALGGLDGLVNMYDKKIISEKHLYYALSGMAKSQRREFQSILFGEEFEKMSSRYKDILLKAMFYDPPKPN